MLRAARHAQCVCVPSPPPPQAVAFAARLLGTHAPSWTRDELAAARAELDAYRTVRMLPLAQALQSWQF